MIQEFLMHLYKQNLQVNFAYINASEDFFI